MMGLDTDLLAALEAIPGALIGIAPVYVYGAGQGNERLVVGEPERGMPPTRPGLGGDVAPRTAHLRCRMARNRRPTCR